MAKQKRQKVHSLTGRIDMARMRKAFKRVKRNGGAPGVDRVTIRMFEVNLEQNLAALMYDLKHRGHYHSLPLLRVYIPKGKGKSRALGIPTVRDRVAQEVVRSLLEPIFEPTFIEESFGFRPGRDAHQAIGVAFLGFHLARRTASVRLKSVDKFKDRIRSLTIRSHNLDQHVIRDLNRVITGFAHFFATPFSTVKEQFYLLDAWIRMRLRCMKYKRISRGDNQRFPNKRLARMGLVSLSSFAQ